MHAVTPNFRDKEEPATTTIYLVRHGETAMNASYRCQGTMDEALSEAGEAQIRALAQRLGPIAFDAVYSSSLQRARRTAEILSQLPRANVRTEDGLIELDYGECQGLTHKEWPGGMKDFWHTTPWEMKFRRGEALHDVRERAVPVFTRIVSNHRGETILVVAHGHVNRVLLLHALGLPDERFWTFEQSNAETWKLEFQRSDGAEYRLRSANEVAMLLTPKNGQALP